MITLSSSHYSAVTKYQENYLDSPESADEFPTEAFIANFVYPDWWSLSDNVVINSLVPKFILEEQSEEKVHIGEENERIW